MIKRTSLPVEPVCRHLPIAPQTYYAAKGRPPSKRALSDEVTIQQIHTVNYGVYRVRKVHAELRRNGDQVARCTVERLMKREGLRCIRRAKGPRTTIQGPLADRSSDLAERRFSATAPGLPLGRRHHLHSDVLRMGLRRRRHRCVRPSCRRLATIDQPAHRPCPRRVENEDLDRAPRRPGPVPTDTSQRLCRG